MQAVHETLREHPQWSEQELLNRFMRIIQS